MPYGADPDEWADDPTDPRHVLWERLEDDLPGADRDPRNREMQALMHIGFFDRDAPEYARSAAREELADWTWNRYSMDLNDVVDWQGWREWMGYG